MKRLRVRSSSAVVLVAVALLAVSCNTEGGPETTTTAAVRETTTTTVPAEPVVTPTVAVGVDGAVMRSDFGVDVESRTITLGMLVDLTGAFASLVTDVTDAQRVYWDKINAAGGVDGWTVEFVVEDTNHDPEQHLEKYGAIRNDIAAIGLAAGSPMTAETLAAYREDNMLVVPMDWYSGWGIPGVDGGVILEQNTNYCLEAMNIIDFINNIEGKTVALATFPGTYGEDAAAGVKEAIKFYGMTLVYDGEAMVNAGSEQTEVIQAIVDSGADWTFLATNPSIGAEILAGAKRSGYEGKFTGSVPSYDFRLLDSASAELYDTLYLQASYTVGWGDDAPGNAAMMDAMREAYPDRRPSDGFILGWNESIAMHQVLEAAIDGGDLTRRGLVRAANALETIEFFGSAPDQSYEGAPNDYVQRSIAMFNPDLATYQDAGGSAQTLTQAGATTGSEMITDGFFIGEAAAAYDFTSPCYDL